MFVDNTTFRMPFGGPESFQFEISQVSTSSFMRKRRLQVLLRKGKHDEVHTNYCFVPLCTRSVDQKEMK